MRESCITLKTFSQRTREKRKERKKKTRGGKKKLFRVLNTLNVWVLSRFSLGRHSSLVRSYICAVNTTDKTLRLAFSHVLSLSAKYLCETTRDICCLCVVVRVFSCCCCCCVLLEERENSSSSSDWNWIFQNPFPRTTTFVESNRSRRRRRRTTTEERVRIKWPQR